MVFKWQPVLFVLMNGDADIKYKQAFINAKKEDIEIVKSAGRNAR